MAIAPDQFVKTIGQGDSVNYEGYKKLMTYLSGSGAPSGAVTPEFIGQEYFATGTADFYRATGLTNTDWKQITA